MSRLDQLIGEFLPVFNDHQETAGDHDLTMTAEQAKRSGFFLHWCKEWGDDERGELAEILEKERGTV